MASTLRLASFRALAVVATLFGLALCAVPLFGIHGVESALVLGVVLPPMAAALGARVTIAARASGGVASAGELAARALTAGLALLALPVLVLALNALRVRNCEPLQGLAWIGLGPGMGVVLASLIGVLAASAIGRSVFATAAAIGCVLATLLGALLRLYATPAIFAYGHFFGYLPGSFYDELIPIPGPLLTLRALDVAFALGLLALLQAHLVPERVRLQLRPRAGSTVLSVVGLLAIGLWPYAELLGSELGLRTSASHIEAVLGHREETARCELILPRELHAKHRAELAADCDFRVEQMERWLGLTQPAPVRVYVFRSANERRHLMGAAGTNIAKPWRNEVYLLTAGWPHPVLAHELAHVIAGNVAPGPLGLSGSLGGLWPDPSLVEGLAVAAAWADSSSGDLTPHEWARAAVELRKAPPLGDLFGTGFFGQSQRLAYTLSGSLLRFIAETQGSKTLRTIYRTGSLAPAGPLPDLEARWREYVKQVPLSPDARAITEAQLAARSILSAPCPHHVAALRQQLGHELAAGDDPQALASCDELIAIDPHDDRTRATLVPLLARSGDSVGAQQQLSALGDAPPTTQLHARHALADEAWRRGDRADALRSYRALASEPQSEGSRRLLEVKALALEAGGRQAQLLFDLLVGEPGLTTEGAFAVHLTRELRGERDDGLPHYLESRQLVFLNRYAEAAVLLATAQHLGLPTEALQREALRLQAFCLVGAGELDAAATAWRRLATDPSPARQAEANDWLTRIRFLKR